MIKQDELSKTRVVAEAEMNLQGCQQLDVKAVSAYATDLRNILEESEVAPRKAFLRSFTKKIVVYKERARLYYKLPVPPDGRRMAEYFILKTLLIIEPYLNIDPFMPYREGPLETWYIFTPASPLTTISPF